MAQISARSEESLREERKEGSRFSSGKFYSPGVSMQGQMTCCCGFELIKQDETTYRCTGGGHVYHFQQGDMMIDKFGNVVLRVPTEQKNKK